MIMDKRTEFCDRAALNTSVGTVLIGNVVDLEVGSVDLGQGNPLYLNIMVSEAATSAGAAKASFALVSDAQEAIAADGSATVHMDVGLTPVADMTEGKTLFCGALPAGDYERYVGILQTTETAAFTGGKINAFLTLDPHGWKAYSDKI